MQGNFRSLISSVSQAGNSLFLNYAPVPEPVHILFAAVIGAGVCYVRRRREVGC